MKNPETIGSEGLAEWDRFVAGHPLGQIYHLAAWKAVLERSFRHIRGYCYVIRDENGMIQAGIPVYRVRSWLTGTRLVCAPYATLFDPLVANKGQMESLARAILEDSRRFGCSHVEVRTYRGYEYLEGSVLKASYFFKHHYLNLDEPAEALKRKFHRTCVRQRISRAEQSGFRLKAGSDENDLRAFYGLFSRTRARKGLPLQPFVFFKALWDELKPSGLLTLLLAQKDGRCVAAVLILAHKERASAEFAAADESYRSYSPMHFVFWEAIKWASERGFRIFDFGRTSPKNLSLMEFKERWGTVCVDLPQFFYPGDAAAIAGRREGGWQYEMLRKLLASPMPSVVREKIGALCYKHMG